MTRGICMVVCVCAVLARQGGSGTGGPLSGSDFAVKDAQGTTDDGYVAKCYYHYRAIFDAVNLGQRQRTDCQNSCRGRGQWETQLRSLYALVKEAKDEGSYAPKTYFGDDKLTLEPKARYDERAKKYINGDRTEPDNSDKKMVDRELQSVGEELSLFWENYKTALGAPDTSAALTCHENLQKAYMTNVIEPHVVKNVNLAAKARGRLDIVLDHKNAMFVQTNAHTSDVYNPTSPFAIEHLVNLANTLQSDLRNNVAPWTTRQLVKVLRVIAKAERWVEALFPTPHAGTDAQRIQYQTKLAVPQYIQTMALLGSLDVVLAEETKRRVDEINALRPVLIAAEGVASKVTTVVEEQGNYSDKITEGIENAGHDNITRLYGQLNQSKDILTDKLARLNAEFKATNQKSIDQLEAYIQFTDQELSTKITGASDRSQSDLVADEQTIDMLESTLKRLLSQVEGKVQMLTVLLQDLAAATETFGINSRQRLTTVNEAATAAVDAVNTAADLAHNQREVFVGTVPLAKDAAEQTLKMFNDRAHIDVLSKGTSTNKALATILETISDKASDVDDGARQLLAEMATVVGDRKLKWETFRTINNKVFSQWTTTKKSMQEWFKGFNSSVRENSASAATSADDAASKMAGDLMQVNNTVNSVDRNAVKEIADVVDFLAGLTTQTTNEMLQELNGIRVVPAEHLHDLVRLADEALLDFDDAIVPGARDTLRGAWQFNEDAADFIVNRTVDDLAALAPEVEALENIFSNNVTATMTALKTAMFSSVEGRQQEMNSYFQELNQLVKEVQNEVRASGGKVYLYMNDEQKNIRAVHGSIVNSANTLRGKYGAVSNDFADAETQFQSDVAAARSAESNTVSDAGQEITSGSKAISDAASTGQSGVNSHGSNSVMDVTTVVEVLDKYLHANAPSGDPSARLHDYSENAEALGNETDEYETTTGISNQDINDADRNCTAMIQELKRMFQKNSGSVQSTIAEFVGMFGAEVDGVFSNTTWQAIQQIATAGSTTGLILNNAGHVIGVDVNHLDMLLDSFGLDYDAVAESVSAGVSDNADVGTGSSTTLHRDARMLKAVLSTFAADAGHERDRLAYEKEKDALGMEAFLNTSKAMVQSFITNMKRTNSSIHMETFDAEMRSRIDSLESDLTFANSSLDNAISIGLSTLAQLNASTREFERNTNGFVHQTDALEDAASQTEITAMHTSSRQLDTARKAVDRAVDEFARETSGVFGTVNHTIDTLLVLHGATEAQVHNVVSSYQKNLGDADWGLARAMELEQYQENSTLERVEDDLDRLDTNVTRLQQWRTKAEEDWEAWRNKTEKAFASLGVNLTYLEDEAEDAKAAEKFAAQQAINHLTAHFSDELGSMSENARSVLIKFTAEAGTEIRNLMQNNQLDDAQKARKLAQIKEKLRLKALSVLRGGFASRLQNAALERKLHSAASEVESAIRQMSTWFNDKSVDSGNIDGMLDELEQDVKKASSDVPSAFVERGASSAAVGMLASDRELADRDTRLEKALLAMVSRRDVVLAAPIA